MTRLLLVPLALALSTTAFAIPGAEGEEGSGQDESFPGEESDGDFDRGPQGDIDTFIVNGRVAAEGEFPETVFISAAAPSGGGNCTATVVDPEGYWLLTAAHCIPADAPDDGITAYTGVFGDQDPVKSVGWMRHSSWDDNDVPSQGKDIAVVELAEPIEVFPMALNDQDMDDSWIDLEVTHIGYGKTATNRSDGGTKRVGDVPITAIGEDAFPDDGDLADQVFTYDGDQAVCQGDSGGPGVVFSGAGYVQAMIHSWGSVPCGSGADGNIRVDKYIGWLRARSVPFITSPGGPPDFVCSHRLDEETDDSVSLGVVPFTIRCQVDYHAPEQLTRIEWRFGDGGTAEGMAVEHEYSRAGNFTVAMCATTQLSEDTETTHCVQRPGIVTACEVPEAGFELEPIEGLTWQVVNRTNVSTYGCITNLVWEVYDENGELWGEYGGWEPEITFEEPGEYRIVQNIGGFAGDDAAELTVDARRRVGGCNSLGNTAGFGAFGLLLGAALLRRRRR